MKISPKFFQFESENEYLFHIWEIYAFLFLASGEKQVFEAVSGCHWNNNLKLIS